MRLFLVEIQLKEMKTFLIVLHRKKNANRKRNLFMAKAFLIVILLP